MLTFRHVVTTDRTRARNRGKAHERRVAKQLNGKRHPSNGRGDEPDVSTPWQTVECKVWARLPAQVERALIQAENTAEIRAHLKNEVTLPMAVIKSKGSWLKNALVVIRMADFEEWFGDA